MTKYHGTIDDLNKGIPPTEVKEEQWKYEIGDKVTFIMGGTRHMVGTIFNRFAATEFRPVNTYAIYFGKKERTTVIAETLIGIERR